MIPRKGDCLLLPLPNLLSVPILLLLYHSYLINIQYKNIPRFSKIKNLINVTFYPQFFINFAHDNTS